MELIKKILLPFLNPSKKELGAILILLIIFFLFPFLIRKIDITAAAVDPGVLSLIILAAFAVLIFKAFTWYLIKTIWPVFANYSVYHFERNFRALSGLQKVMIYLGFYLLILYSFVIVLAALI